jgi:hypothetical protein
MACMLQRIRLRVCRLCLLRLGGLVRLLCFVCTNGMVVGRAVVRLVLVGRSVCRVRFVGVSSHAPSACASAAQAPCFRFDVGLMCVSPCLLCFLFCMFTLCHPIQHMCVNAPPSGLPIPDPYCITSSVCLLIAQSHCRNHFVLHDSRRDRLPRFPCLLPTSCDRGTHMQLTDCLTSWIAQRVQDVFHVAGFPHSCMTSC